MLHIQAIKDAEPHSMGLPHILTTLLTPTLTGGGGGGGLGSPTFFIAPGGRGGGGRGAAYYAGVPSVAGTPNTGGGGGGGTDGGADQTINDPFFTGESGGTGVVLIRYPLGDHSSEWRMQQLLCLCMPCSMGVASLRRARNVMIGRDGAAPNTIHDAMPCSFALQLLHPPCQRCVSGYLFSL